MSLVQNAKERRALERLSYKHWPFRIRGELTFGISSTMLNAVVDLDLVENCPSEWHRPQFGWRNTPNGWHCMFGKPGHSS
jgi:hypothetical protein